MTAEWQVRTGSAADLELVGPLWVAVHHRHAETMPELAPYVSDDDTWHARRALYEELLVKPDTLLLLGFVEELILGALPGNRDAIRLYERHGYQPTWLYLSRWKGRNHPLSP